MNLSRAKTKKLVAIVLTFITVFALTACGPKPSEAVKSDLDKIKDADTSVSALSVMADQDSATKEKNKKVVEMIKDFDYEIVSEKVDGNKAKVKVKITTYDFGKAYKEGIAQAVIDAKSGKITSASQVKSYVYNLLYDKMLAMKSKDYEDTITINCKKKDGEWTTDVDKDNDELVNAITGGLSDAVSATTVN